MKRAIGIPSGSLQEVTINLLKKIGITVVVSGRQFIAAVNGSDLFDRAVIIRPNDLPMAVHKGIIDAALTGYDMLCEADMENDLCVITELLFAKKSRCPTRVVVFGRNDENDEIVDNESVAVSAEYMQLARRVFRRARVEFSTGSTEIKIAEKAFGFRYGVGVVESGQSLIDNGLKIIKEIIISPVVLISREQRESLTLFGQTLKGALDAENTVLIKFNISVSDVEGVLKHLPAMEAPTISSLSDGAYAIETVVLRSVLANTLTTIKKNGGRNILVQDICITI